LEPLYHEWTGFWMLNYEFQAIHSFFRKHSNKQRLFDKSIEQMRLSRLFFFFRNLSQLWFVKPHCHMFPLVILLLKMFEQREDALHCQIVAPLLQLFN